MGGRGASSSNKTEVIKSRVENKTTIEAQQTSTKTTLSNKKEMIDFVKKQTNIDLTKVLEPREAKSRTYLGVHLEDLSRNQRNEVIRTLKRYGRNTRIEDNGGLGYAIYYDKKNK